MIRQKHIKTALLLCGGAFFLFFGLMGQSLRDSLRPGDILFQTSTSAQSEAIRLATNSKWSHCGMVVEEAGVLKVIEAVQPVKITPLKEWIARGEGSHFVAKRYQNPISDSLAANLADSARIHLNKDYDLPFDWSDEKMYCSELVWKAWTRGAGIELCPLNPLKNYSLDHPLVRAKLHERYGKNLPLEMPMVAPQDIFESPFLKTVWEE